MRHYFKKRSKKKNIWQLIITSIISRVQKEKKNSNFTKKIYMLTYSNKKIYLQRLLIETKAGSENMYY